LAAIAQLLSLRGELVDSRPDGAWFVIRPFALAGKPLELLVGIGCFLLLISIFVVEVLTPDNVVVATFALLPLAAAAWVLSGRFAALVMSAAAVLFVAAGLIEPTIRLTLLFIAIPVLAVGAIARLYAGNVARLAAAGRPARPDDNGHLVSALTRRELEVARLAASAYTAAEIGQRLHIGERTVESHIASAYLKLQISSRSELIRMAEKLS
jgi:DNA-binding CsgD family transcriptional regulator